MWLECVCSFLLVFCIEPFYTVYSLQVVSSWEAGFDSLPKLEGWLRFEVPPPILAVFLPCRLP